MIDPQSNETVEAIMDYIRQKVIDWGQDAPIGMTGVADAVAERTAEFRDTLKSELSE